VLAVDLDPYRKAVVLNKGSHDDALYPGQPIVDAYGVMGKLLHVNPWSSTAMLITDPNHALPVQVARNGLRAIAVGAGTEDHLELQHPFARIVVEPSARLTRSREVLLVWPGLSERPGNPCHAPQPEETS